MSIQIHEQFNSNELNIFTGGLNKVINDVHKRYNPVYPKIFNVIKTGKKYNYDAVFNGYGYMQEAYDNMDEVEIDRFSQIGRTLHNVKTYALSVGIGFDTLEDDQEGVMADAKKMSAKIAKADLDTKEYWGAHVFNSAFTSTITGGYDGVCLCSASHTATTGGNQDNTSNVDLDYSSLESAVTYMRKRKNDRNMPVNIMPKKLFVPEDLMPTAKRIMDSLQVAGGALNDKNWIASTYGIEVVSSPWLTDTDAWFLIGDDVAGDGLVMYNRLPLTAHMDVEPARLRYITTFRTRYVFGWNDWRYVEGSAGA